MIKVPLYKHVCVQYTDKRVHVCSTLYTVQACVCVCSTLYKHVCVQYTVHCTSMCVCSTLYTVQACHCVLYLFE